MNAAGAWGDVVAARAGVEPIGLQPCRRTAFMVNGPGGDATGWSFTADVGQNWYVKHDGEQMLCSLGDETPSKPCDAKPAELDVALAIERINQATTLGIQSVNSAWAGLRTFTPDRSLAIGPDSDSPRSCGVSVRGDVASTHRVVPASSWPTWRWAVSRLQPSAVPMCRVSCLDDSEALGKH